MANTFNYPNVSPAVFDAILKELRNALPGTNPPEAQSDGTLKGEISGNGIGANYIYDPNAQVLIVGINDHPFFISVSDIQTHVTGVVNTTRARVLGFPVPF